MKLTMLKVVAAVPAVVFDVKKRRCSCSLFAMSKTVSAVPADVNSVND